MISWWPSDGNANDIQDGNHGTLQNGATFAAGKVGQAFSFDGIDDLVSTPLTVSYGGGATFDAWVSTTDDAGLVISDGGGASAHRGMGLFLEPGGKIDLFGTKGSGALNFLAEGPVISDGIFHHVAGTWTGDDTTDGVKLYVDGALVNSTTALESISTGSTPIHFGWHTTITGHEKLAGLIDEIEIFERPLTALEIQAIYNAGIAGKCKVEPTTVGGEILSIDMTSMFVVGAFTNAGWILPAVGLTAAGIVGFALRKRIKSYLRN
jgi:hypothetical protein